MGGCGPYYFSFREGKRDENHKLFHKFFFNKNPSEAPGLTFVSLKQINFFNSSRRERKPSELGHTHPPLVGARGAKVNGEKDREAKKICFEETNERVFQTPKASPGAESQKFFVEAKLLEKLKRPCFLVWRVGVAQDESLRDE